MRRRYAAALAGASLLLGAGVVAINNATAATVLTDGYYACTFPANGLACQTAAIPTVTVTSTVTATPPPTPTPSPTPTLIARLVGESFGGSSVSNVTSSTAAFPEQTLGRYYFSGLPATFSATPALQATKPGEPLFLSFKTMPTDAAFAAELTDWQASGRRIWWTYQHEPEDNGNTPAQYVANWNHLLAVAANTAHPAVRSMTVLIAQDLADGSAEQWYVPGVDMLGFDCYQLVNQPRSVAYAKSKGKPVAFPEIGDGVTAGKTDADSLAWARSFFGAWDPYGFGAAWFNAGVNTLTTRPQTLAYLRTLP